MSTEANKAYRVNHYDGTNGTAIATELGTTPTYDGTTLQVGGFDVPLDYWLIWSKRNEEVVYEEVLSDDDYNRLYSSTAESVAPPTLVESIGTLAVPARLLAGTYPVDVDISPAMPDATYIPIVTLRGTPAILNGIAGHTIASHSVIDANTVRVNISSGAASLAGATVVVQAYAIA